ncbi:MAG: hypothetical protein FD143_1419 [Ignavibacteria bacterium]|nr:MAG: hypothetical protein FD143_1419 [Ignavibacteria bacterium]KAF0160572.1 MAG: hypothetical protein FD188_1643 [Ignavibacteria bacterium]
MEFVANLHPIVVHFPIAVFVLYSLSEITALILKKDWLGKITIALLGIGVVSSIFGALTGSQAYTIIKPVLNSKEAVVEATIIKHEQFATITLWYFLFLLILKTYLLIQKKQSQNWKIVFCILSLVGIYFVYETSLLGGKLVYEFGVGTQLFNK